MTTLTRAEIEAALTVYVETIHGMERRPNLNTALQEWVTLEDALAALAAERARADALLDVLAQVREQLRLDNYWRAVELLDAALAKAPATDSALEAKANA